MSSLPKNSLVLVSGANGWIASRIVDTLIQHNFRVRGTFRSDASAEWLRQHIDSTYGPDKLEVAIVPDIANDGAFDEAIIGVKAFIHVASVTSFSSNPDEVIPIAVKGAEVALSAAMKEPGLERFVFTSSIGGAYVLRFDTPRDIYDDSYADEAVGLAHRPGPMQALMVYSASKVLAEKTVWKFAAEQKPHFVINTIVPNRNIGPPLAPGKQSLSSGGAIPGLYMKGWEALGMMKAVPSQHYVDVRDTALLHIAPLVDGTIQNERIFAASHAFSWNDVLEILHKVRPNHKLPEPSDDRRKDLYNIIPSHRAVEILHKNFGQSAFITLEDSVLANIAHLP